jgi:hypothetical protein
MPLDAIQQEIGRALGYEPLTADTAAQPYPVETVLPSSQVRPATEDDDADPGWPMISWKGDWYPAPTMDQVETWTFDSVCESPDEDVVEPDDKSSWLSILGLI